MDRLDCIETQRLILRPFRLDDDDDFAPICADPDVMRYIGGGAHDKTVTQQKISQWIANYEHDGFGLMAMIRKDNKQLIGFCGLIRQIIDEEPYIELGYRLGKDQWDQGLATEAAIAVRDYAFNSLKLPDLISIIHEDNVASQRVAGKVGMTLFKKTVFHDVQVHVYRIINH